jgi:hypothetical protein
MIVVNHFPNRSRDNAYMWMIFFFFFIVTVGIKVYDTNKAHRPHK